MAAGPDRHLLFGLLALQLGLIDLFQLVLAFHASTRDQARTLDVHLRACGTANAERRGLRERLAAEPRKNHGGDAGKNLAAVGVGKSVRRSLAALDGPQINSTLVGLVLGADGDGEPEHTAAYAVV